MTAPVLVADASAGSGEEPAERQERFLTYRGECLHTLPRISWHGMVRGRR